jgi:predicted lipoprotein with Yx(FWY)xxD motif
MRRTPTRLVWATVAGLTLAGCGGSSGDDAGTGGQADAPAAEDAALATASSGLGEIVVDAEGRTVYYFDKDTAGSGASACTGQCLDNWPAVTADSSTPAVDGVTGEVGTIERNDGTRQVTLDGMPLYTFVGDAEAGDVAGQGVQGVWWVVAPDGAKVSAAPPAPGY